MTSRAFQTLAKGHGFLNVAMRRFAEGNERHRVEDRIIDLMIAAEALSQCNASQAKGRPIAEYIATHVGDPDKNKVQKHLQDTYRLRNSIVHDGDALGWLKAPLLIQPRVGPPSLYYSLL